MKALEISIHTYNYQRRLCWMLSSILQQTGNTPDIVVSISYTPNNGNPTTESVISFFREKGLNIIDVILKKEEVSNRAIARNIRTKETTADWILFADCDMVYDRLFFDHLKKEVEKDKYKNETKVIGADRYSLDDNFCIKFFEEDNREYPCVIDNVSDITKLWPIKWIRGGDVAPGYFQLAKMSNIRNNGIVYSGKNRDVWRSTKSDREFRLRMGGRVKINTLPQYHLNHDRQGPDIQR